MSNISYQRKAFYLPAKSGQLFCLHYLPAQKIQSQVLFVPPFAEELNRSRRLMSLMATKLAQQGHEVLIIDLYGTGDSEGNFIDATWQIWKQDLLDGFSFLQKSNPDNVIDIIAIRLGTLLILDSLNNQAINKLNKLIAWQPIFDSHKYIKQFMRLELATKIIQKNNQPIDQKSENKINYTEVAGYLLSDNLRNELTQLLKNKDTNFNQFKSMVLCQITSSSSTDFSSEIQSYLLEYKQQSKTESQEKLDVKLIQGDAFWQNYGVNNNPELLNITKQLLSSNDSNFMGSENE